MLRPISRPRSGSRPSGGTKSTRVPRLIRSLAVSVVAGWALYASTMVRSWQAGAEFHVTLLLTFAFAGPCALAVFLGLPWRRLLAAAVVLLGASATTAEGLAAIEETRFVRRHQHQPADSPAVFQPRWWPHTSSYLSFDPSTGRLGGGD